MSNLNEELGQVDTILSDKMGTLTCNSMEFVKCSVGGKAYGHGVTEVEKAMAKRKGSFLNGNDDVESPERSSLVKGFNFDDEWIMNGNWVDEPRSDVVRTESPDEAAFVIAARELGFEFFKRRQKNVYMKELNPVSGKMIGRSFELLNVLGFNSSRKRMSVIVTIKYEDDTPVDAKGVGRKILGQVYETYKTELAGKRFAYDGEKSLFSVYFDR
ncbi:ATPase E1-E2 type family protein / haloaciddehalogenase-like hydrolase family protein [Striga asiatica]|uniref:ATPase E1-E2 type family protein / haloaciddehalogenase-like hydrolase family protein n=1 Tax=Striga asiatica TaxID=4170 RepID=A0A5A7QI21_STRAF|nr:ATPase E1-E2 type family protein / haloaciddehalogenase-like hydrolase family protein [Striga asiatica]